MNVPVTSLPVPGIVDRLLHQRLADALHGAAVDLARQHQRIERHSEIIDDDVVDDTDHARCRVDLDFRHMSAVGKGASPRC